MMEGLIAILFVSREFAHRRHLAVTGPGSYAAHVALGSFYDDIIDNADAIAEAYQGRHGLMEEIPYLACPTGKKTIAATATWLEEQMNKISEIRYDACPKKESAIQNLIDEAIATYLSALYKLRNLE
jgi:DNA-binding ferritin-like protein